MPKDSGMIRLMKQALKMKAVLNEPNRTDKPPIRAGPIMLPQLVEKVTIDTAIPVLIPGSDPALLIKVGYSME